MSVAAGDPPPFDRPLWVISGRSASYQANVCFRAYSGRSSGRFLTPNRLCPLFSKADVQMLENGQNQRAAFGQKRTSRAESNSSSAANFFLHRNEFN